MPSVLHAPMINTTNFVVKEKSGEPFVSAFTAVNGRTSPPTPRSLNGMNGMSTDTIHVRPLARNSPDHHQDSKLPLAGREEWSSAPRVTENGHHSDHHSVSPSLSGNTSPNSPAKRKRTSSVEDDGSYHSPADSSAPPRRRLDSYASVGRDDSPNTVSQLQHSAMEHSQSRTLPPMERAETERTWPPTSQDVPHNGYQDSQHQERRVVDAASQDGMNPSPTSQAQMSGVESHNGVETSSTTEITRAGVQVDPKKRKRQFANRTKTGCGTCRRRKKKCDEAKPECNNCLRGGFICEGYANKVPWPKNGTSKPPPPLQAKDRFPVDPAQLYHSHGPNRESYPDPNIPNNGNGARNQPIVVEEHDRQPVRNGWGTGWGTRPSYPPEHHQPPEYSQPPPSATHGRPPSSEHHVPHPAQGLPRQHNPRIYHHTPQTMSQVVNNSPVVTAEAALHHQSQQPQPPHQPQQHPVPSTAGPPGLPPPHYGHPPPRAQKSEKDKMLSGEPFMPFAHELVDERERCKGAVYRFNNTDNTKVEIARAERDRQFFTIIAARWVQHFRGADPPRSGHCASDVFVDTPFMCDYGYNLSIAEGVDIGTGCKFLDSGRITIGRNTTIEANVTINTQKIPIDSKAPKGRNRTAIAADIHIGESVHIGANCTINAGVRIGNGAIVHPGSVVAGDVPRDTIVRGNPAQVKSVNWDD